MKIRHLGDSKQKNIFVFTMIELMVVLGIILILAAMLLPTLASSKDSAKATFCVNNIKNLGLAAFQYSQEWETFVAWGSDRKTANLTRWHGKRDSVSNSSAYYPEEGPLHTYLKSKFIECPILKDTVDIKHSSVEKGGGGYGYNLYLGTRAYFVDDPESEEAYQAGILTKDLRHPDTTVMFTDSAGIVTSTGALSSSPDDFLAEYSICNSPFSVNHMETQTGVGYNDPSIHFRHAKQANIGWGDGHVDAELMEWTLNSGCREKQLGFWGKKDDNALFDPQ